MQLELPKPRPKKPARVGTIQYSNQMINDFSQNQMTIRTTTQKGNGGFSADGTL